MRILLFTIGTLGDVAPLRMLGRALARRGHQVTLATSPFLCADSAAGAVRCVPIGDGDEQGIRAVIASLAELDRSGRDRFFFEHWTAPQLRGARAAIDRELAAADYWVSNIPLSPPLRSDGQGVPGARIDYGPRMTPHVERPGARVLDLVPCSAALAGFGTELATGFWHEAGTTVPAPAAMGDFVADPRPLLVLTMGSMDTFDAPGLGALLYEALERIDARAVIVGGWARWQLPADSAERLLLVGHADYAWLFARASCVLHHGGSGTIAAALRAGVAQIVLPQLACQQQGGAALMAQGVCADVLDTGTLTLDALMLALRRALDDKSIRAATRAWQARVLAEDGLGEAVARIELHAAGLGVAEARVAAQAGSRGVDVNEADIADFYARNAPLFAQRRIYSMTQFHVAAPPARSAEIAAWLAEIGSLQGWLERLLERGIVYTAQAQVSASEDLPSDLLDGVHRLKAGDVFPVYTRSGLAAIVLSAIEPSPRSLAHSRADIAAFLRHQQLRQRQADGGA